MHTVHFEGAIEISKPEDMTDEQCFSVWAKFGFDRLYKIIESNGMMKIPEGLYAGVDRDNFPFYMTAWKPNKEDLDALNKGLPIYIKTISKGLPPMAVFTMDENGSPNWD